MIEILIHPRFARGAGLLGQGFVGQTRRKPFRFRYPPRRLTTSLSLSRPDWYSHSNTSRCHPWLCRYAAINEQSITKSNACPAPAVRLTSSTFNGVNLNSTPKCRRYVFSFNSLYRLKFVKLTLPHTTRIVENSVTKNFTCGLRKHPLLPVGSVQLLP